jgi:hypothetical protein
VEAKTEGDLAVNQPQLTAGWRQRFSMFGLEKRIADQVLRRIRSKRGLNASSKTPVAPAVGTPRRREVEFADCSKVSALKHRHRLSFDSASNWHRLWRDNPAIEDSERMPMGWVLEGDEGLVGYLGNIRLRCFYLGKALKVATSHGLIVEPGYRAHAATLVAAYFRQSDVDLLVSTSANESANKIYQAFRARPLPQADYDTVLFWVIDPHGFLVAVKRKLQLNGTLATIGTRVMSWLLHAEKSLRQRQPCRRSQIYKLRELSPSAIDSDFDAFWRKKLATATGLIADRSAATLRWHFDVTGDQRKPTIVRCDYSGRMVGYAVVLTDTVDGGLKKASIVDMLVEDEDSSVSQQLLIAAFEYARRTDHHVLELLGFPRAIRKICESWNPYTRRFPSSPYLFKATDHRMHISLESEDAWYATPYDGDATLIPHLIAESTPATSDRYQLV